MEIQGDHRPVYFFSDAHLGADEPACEAKKLAALRTLVERVAREQAHAVILGDLFDFGFDYGAYVQPGHQPVLELLRGLRERGLPVTFVGGNHDFWLGPALARDLGVTVVDGAATLILGGQRCFIAHGDGLDPREAGYRLLKSLLRARWAIALYRRLPKPLGIALALRCSRLSRRHLTAGRYADPAPLRAAAEEIFTRGFRAVVLGHSHVPVLVTDPLGRTYLNVGDLSESFTCGLWRDGKFTLETLAAAPAAGAP